MRKALWYVTHQSTHIVRGRTPEGEKMFYVLQKDNEYGANKISQRIIDMHAAALRGQKDARVKDLDTLIDLCSALHIVNAPLEGFEPLECEGNPLRYVCQGCKGFLGTGICSHVLSVNHMESKFNVRAELRALTSRASKRKAALAGNRKRPPPALESLPAPVDSSEDEAEQEQALFLEGR